MTGRRIEWIDHLHEHFVDPAVVVRGRYRAPVSPGASTEMLPTSIAEYSFPNGPVWAVRGIADEKDAAAVALTDEAIEKI